MAKPTIDLEIAVKAAVVRPGDTLVLVTSKALSPAAAGDMRTRLEAALPDVKGVVVSEVDQALVYKPAGTDEPYDFRGVWLAHYGDWSAAQVFARKADADAYAVEHSMTTTFWRFGEDMPR